MRENVRSTIAPGHPLSLYPADAQKHDEGKGVPERKI